jgi:putative aldouronate transport system substrate-binding protein
MNNWTKTPLPLLAATVAAFSLLVFFPSCQKREGAAASGKPAAITVEVFDRGTDGGKSNPANNNWTDWIQKKVLEDEHIAVTFVPVNRWEETTAINTLLAAAGAPDVSCTYNNEMVAAFGLQGGIFDMAPYVDSHLPDLKQLLGPDPQMPGNDLIWRNKNRDNGALYSISNRYMYTASQNLFIRKDWLDTLGLPVPTTPEEYFDALTAFREQDPGGVGKNRVVPFTMTRDVRWTGAIIAFSFIDPAVSSKERWINSVADRLALVPGYKNGIRFLNRMYNAGLIDRDFPLYSGDTWDSLIKSGVVGSFCQSWDYPYRESPNLLKDLQRNVPGALFIPVDTFPAADGVTRKPAASLAGGLSVFIPKTCKNPEAALRYINWLARPENNRFLQFGQEGVNHQIVNGVPKNIPATGGWVMNSGGNVDYTISVNGYLMETPALTAQVIANNYAWPPEYITEAYRVSSTNAFPEPVVPVTLYAAGPLTQTLADKCTVLFVESITAKPADFDRVWNDGVQDWLASGAQTVIDERREKYIAP